ncbi:tRNA(Met) cytidine acetyltransferase TmcA [Vibrio stylophorae]|uniref:tRNA(Met) cytidine acetyltransferase TmcA n=1 Tax=Vibrio stylophorae TaxID=659351 RepID=A0ABM8ZYH9_9VIBR|nr:GNAT family N-acetyltransferase [Vibrio stylophorae]CAH0535816.1 tRNA(Met) cytidine acetyltransferase TmcA [Vibrio stylophorae]
MEYSTLISTLRLHQHRQLVVLCGEQAWCESQAQLAMAEFAKPLWLARQASHDGTTVLAPEKVQQLLGQTISAIVMNGFDGISAKALAVCHGCVAAGGVLFLLLPEELPRFADPDLKRWRTFFPYGDESAFLRRLERVLRADHQVVWYEQNKLSPCFQLSHHLPVCGCDCTWRLTDDQEKAIELIQHVATGHRHRPLVIQADRGRGKSTSLGLAAKTLAAQGKSRLVIVAPSIQQAQTALDHSEHQLEFMAADELLQQQPEVDVLFVDEAAAFPLSILKLILERYRRIVFATTVHGYEGSGRGFQLNFLPYLERVCPQWQSHVLQKPVRWAANDPLEQTIFSLLMLDASLPEYTKPPLACNQIRHQIFSGKQLGDDAQLPTIFALLVQAHYQTSPDDLRQLLDGEGVAICVAFDGQQIIGVSLIVEEGNMTDSLAQQIKMGTRRLKGHLVAQSIAQLSGVRDGATLRSWRVMRIVVHPQYQGVGIGTGMLDYVCQQAKAQSLDFISTSFGATPHLIQFWQRNGYQLIRLGLMRDAASGTYSAQWIRPLSPAAKSMAVQLSNRLQYNLMAQLQSLEVMEPRVAICLLRSMSWSFSVDLNELQLFCETQLHAEYVKSTLLDAFAVWLYQVPDDDLNIAVEIAAARLCLNQPWSRLQGMGFVQGRKQGERLLRSFFSTQVYPFLADLQCKG